MSTFNHVDCVECQRLAAEVTEIQAQISEARTELQQAIEAADGTSARKHNILEELIKAEGEITSEIRNHDKHYHSGYLTGTILTHDALET